MAEANSGWKDDAAKRVTQIERDMLTRLDSDLSKPILVDIDKLLGDLPAPRFAESESTYKFKASDFSATPETKARWMREMMSDPSVGVASNAYKKEVAEKLRISQAAAQSNGYAYAPSTIDNPMGLNNKDRLEVAKYLAGMGGMFNDSALANFTPDMLEQARFISNKPIVQVAPVSTEKTQGVGLVAWDGVVREAPAVAYLRSTGFFDPLKNNFDYQQAQSLSEGLVNEAGGAVIGAGIKLLRPGAQFLKNSVLSEQTLFRMELNGAMQSGLNADLRASTAIGGLDANASKGGINIGALREVEINGTSAKRILEGTNGEIAIIGRSMHGPGGVVDYAVELNRRGYKTHLFAGDEISAASRREWDVLKEVYGDSNGLIPQYRLMNTVGFQENKAWAQKVVNQGYTIVDIGNPNNSGFSVYYATEKKTIFGNVKK